MLKTKTLHLEYHCLCCDRCDRLWRSSGSLFNTPPTPSGAPLPWLASKKFHVPETSLVQFHAEEVEITTLGPAHSTAPSLQGALAWCTSKQAWDVPRLQQVLSVGTGIQCYLHKAHLYEGWLVGGMRRSGQLESLESFFFSARLKANCCLMLTMCLLNFNSCSLKRSRRLFSVPSISFFIVILYDSFWTMFFLHYPLCVWDQGCGFKRCNNGKVVQLALITLAVHTVLFMGATYNLFYQLLSVTVC